MKSLLVVLLLIAATAQGEMYTWKDSQGTAHYTNSMVEIPIRYRARVKVLNYDTEQKKDASSQPAPVPDQSPSPTTDGTRIRQNSPPPQETYKSEAGQQQNYPRKSQRGRNRRHVDTTSDD